MRVEEDLEKSEGKLYTRDLVVQDCNSYIKQVSSEHKRKVHSNDMQQYQYMDMDQQLQIIDILQYLEKNNLLRTCREFLRECSDLKLPSPSFLNGK